jgi:hypothetical protein
MLAQLASERPKIVLPLLDRITDRVGHLFDRRGRIDAVLIERVKIVGAKPTKGAFHRLTDMLRPAVSIDADLFPDLLVRAITNHGAR